MAAREGWEKLCGEVDALVKDTPALAADPRLEDFARTRRAAFVDLCCELCATVGRFGEAEARVVSLLLGGAADGEAYGRLRNTMANPRSGLALPVFGAMIALLAQDQARRSGAYDPAQDRVIDALKAVARAVFMADGEGSQAEKAVFDRLAAGLAEAAAYVGKAIDQRPAGGKDPPIVLEDELLDTLFHRKRATPQEVTAAAADAGRAWRGLCAELNGFLESNPDWRPEDEPPTFASDLNVSAIWLALNICAADGPVNAAEASVINILTEANQTIEYYRGLVGKIAGIVARQADSTMTEDFVTYPVVRTMMSIAAEQQKRRSEPYDPLADRVIRHFERVAQVACLADGQAGDVEFARVGNMLARLRLHAQFMHHSANPDAAVPPALAGPIAAKEALVAWKALGRRLDDFLEQSPEVRICNRKELPANRDWGMLRLCCLLCAADGPITDQEAAMINILTQDRLKADFYNTVARTDDKDFETSTKGDGSQAEVVVALLELLMRIAFEADRRDSVVYDPAQDEVIAIVEKIGQAILLADGEMSRAETRLLAVLLSRLREIAQQIKALIDPQSPVAGAASTAQETKPDAKDTLEAALADLHALVGLKSVKAEVETLANLAKVQGMRKAHNLPVPDMGFHVVFTGNPGTGKTTVARIVARIYHHLGLVSKGHMIEVDRSGLVAGYVGQTAIKVSDAVNRALGGVLFIDEAYALASDIDVGFGGEAIETLLKLMEDKRDDLAVIAAGYTDRMEGFLSSNPGLRSRFPRTIEFPDYTGEEMQEIFSRMAEGMHYRLDADAEERLKAEFAARVAAKSATFANGREVRNVFERVLEMQANRVAALPKVDVEALARIAVEDVKAAVGDPVA